MYGSSFSSTLSSSFSIISARNGVSVSAVTQLKNNEKHKTQNSEPMNSPVASFDKPIGAKAVIAIMVAPNSGHCVCVTMSFAA
ncbi:hypothetical protein MED222_06405 [Vibrio sp. MED222]|nr:hypothetical protein MED222_06405 [Vibrio sp. MED222]